MSTHPSCDARAANGCSAGRGVLPIAVLAAGLLVLSSCGIRGQQVTLTGSTMGTTYVVKIAQRLPSAISSQSLQQEIDVVLDDVNARMSTYLSDSEVSRFNRFEAETWFEVSPATAEVVEAAQVLSRETNGAVDVTVGPLVRLWHFGAATGAEPFTPPAEDLIEQTLDEVGFAKLAVRREPPALRKTIHALEIDLSAIAKGYAVDRVAELLQSHGIESYMVEIGGEMRVSGQRRAGGPWRIGIEKPSFERRESQVIVPLVDVALATSGDYRNFFVHEGHRYSHIIDPATGRPVEHELASASVLADTCMQADGLATALVVMSPERGYDWAEEHGVAALFISRTDTDYRLRSTSAWKARVSAPEESTEGTAMVTYFVFAVVVFAAAMAAMAVGVLVRNRQLRGSCGGLAGLRDAEGNPYCEACDHPSFDCTGSPDEVEGAEKDDQQVVN